jgi:hypothetical protein
VICDCIVFTSSFMKIGKLFQWHAHRDRGDHISLLSFHMEGKWSKKERNGGIRKLVIFIISLSPSMG